MGENQVSQIRIFEGDDIGIIAQEFGLKHNLDDYVIERLKNLL